MRHTAVRPIILLLLGTLLVLTACSAAAPASPPPPDEPSSPPPIEGDAAESSPEEALPAGPTAAELAALITADIETANWTEAGETELRRFYTWEEGTALDDAVFYMAATNIQADELTVLALADKEAARAALPALEGRLAAQKKNFEGYLPEQEFLLENAVCLTKGRYALLVVSAQAEEIREAFEAAAE
ncbi:MAG: DUF4358 domain-containing protein [Gracilibacteraceae bacterium]|nr:DUF4358 domain-containing protein [Gracilibacteraceae bacterium]